MRMKAKKYKAIIVLGGGGHTAQMIRLVDRLGDAFEYEYIIPKGDPLSERKIKKPGRIWYVTAPRSYDTPAWKAVLNTIRAFFESVIVMTKSDAKVIITAGPGIAIPVCYVGKMFGKKIIFIESWSRVWTPSRTGRQIYFISDLFFVQWPELKDKYPKAIYAGRLG